MRSGIGAPEDHVVLIPQPLPEFPVGLRVIGRLRPEYGAQLIGRHDLDDRFERVDPLLGGDLVNPPTTKLFVLG